MQTANDVFSGNFQNADFSNVELTNQIVTEIFSGSMIDSIDDSGVKNLGKFMANTDDAVCYRAWKRLGVHKKINILVSIHSQIQDKLVEMFTKKDFRKIQERAIDLDMPVIE